MKLTTQQFGRLLLIVLILGIIGYFGLNVLNKTTQNKKLPQFGVSVSEEELAQKQQAQTKPKIIKTLPTSGTVETPEYAHPLYIYFDKNLAEYEIEVKISPYVELERKIVKKTMVLTPAEGDWEYGTPYVVTIDDEYELRVTFIETESGIDENFDKRYRGPMTDEELEAARQNSKN
jgi:hypothetical protein